MRVLMAGSSGFLGSNLAGRLTEHGHQVLRLVRRPAASPEEVRWRPSEGLPPARLAGVDAVINLAGSPMGTSVAGMRLPVRLWTARYREQFRASRVDTTATLAEAIAGADPRPRVFLSGSAVGWYGDTGDTEVDEHSPAGEGYFADVARVWEAATGPAERAGARVVRMRTGLPLDPGGGLLGPQLLPFRLGVGGKLGDGRQWVPWISMTDWLNAVEFLLERDDLAGPVNLVGPAPVRNAEFAKTLGDVLHRPAVMPVPAVVLRTLLNEFGRDVLASKRVLPGTLDQAGFEFTHPDLRSALRAALRA